MDDDNAFQPFTDYSLQVLELCRLLWGPIEATATIQLPNQVYFEEQRRRHMLSNWLHRCILSQSQQQVCEMVDRTMSYSYLYTIFQPWIMQNCEFLSRGLFDDCVKFAHDEGNFRLAALVHAASGSNHVRDALRHCVHEDVRMFSFSLFLTINSLLIFHLDR